MSALISSEKGQITLIRAVLTIRGNSVTVVGIVVVEITRSIHITNVVGVTRVRRTEKVLQPLP